MDGWTVVETHGQVTFGVDTVSRPVGHLDMSLSIHVPTSATIHVSICPHPCFPAWGVWRIQDRLHCPARYMHRAVDGWDVQLEMAGWMEGEMNMKMVGQTDTGTCPAGHTDSSMEGYMAGYIHRQTEGSVHVQLDRQLYFQLYTRTLYTQPASCPA